MFNGTIQESRFEPKDTYNVRPNSSNCCEDKSLALPDQEFYHVSAYIEQLLADGKAKRPAKRVLATIRKLFDWLIIGKVCSINPAQAVEGPSISSKNKHSGMQTKFDAQHFI